MSILLFLQNYAEYNSILYTILKGKIKGIFDVIQATFLKKSLQQFFVLK